MEGRSEHEWYVRSGEVRAHSSVGIAPPRLRALIAEMAHSERIANVAGHDMLGGGAKKMGELRRRKFREVCQLGESHLPKPLH